MMRGQDPFGDYIRSLGVEIEQPKPQPQGPISVRVVFERSNGRFPYTVHCFAYNPPDVPIPEELNRIDLEGRLERRSQFTFTAESITRFAEVVEQVFTRAEVAYHRSMPVLPARGEPMVSYGLMPRLIDKDGSSLSSFVMVLFQKIHYATQGNLANWKQI